MALTTPLTFTCALVVVLGAYQFKLIEAVVSPGCNVRLSTKNPLSSLAITIPENEDERNVRANESAIFL